MEFELGFLVYIAACFIPIIGIELIDRSLGKMSENGNVTASCVSKLAGGMKLLLLISFVLGLVGLRFSFFMCLLGLNVFGLGVAIAHDFWIASSSMLERQQPTTITAN